MGSCEHIHQFLGSINVQSIGFWRQVQLSKPLSLTMTVRAPCNNFSNLGSNQWVQNRVSAWPMHNSPLSPHGVHQRVSPDSHNKWQLFTNSINHVVFIMVTQRTFYGLGTERWSIIKWRSRSVLIFELFSPLHTSISSWSVLLIMLTTVPLVVTGAHYPIFLSLCH